MSDSFFYSQIEANEKNGNFLNKIENFSIKNSKQIYIINKPLGERKYNYTYTDAIILLIPKYKIIFINFGQDENYFEDYFDDFIEDLGYISDKYDYRDILGRPRAWKQEFFEKINYADISNSTIDEFLSRYEINTKPDQRKIEFLISLLTGSINDVERIGGEIPQNILDEIKKKIVLFDGDQTEFIYKEPHNKRITIQGLAGTGKTELLLHKLKDLYVNEDDTKIVFTCHNKILAENLKTRIPEFFNFMKVDEQIKWNERLWTISSWGSEKDSHSGIYSYLCNYYNISFQRYSYTTTFATVCRNALRELEEIKEFEPCFNYILIDESQDFPQEFFSLCEKVTKNTVYIAGDIFQNVFDHEIVSKVTPDFLLNKCYRTDPRTLMFAHAVGMGLLENPKLRWLNDDEWEACGYVIEKSNGMYNLNRKPLRRFEDVKATGTDSIKLVATESDNYINKIINILNEIVDNNKTVTPDDIGIIFLENSKTNYNLANELQILIKQKFGWNVNIGYETKSKQKNTLFVSNRNNVKGLEFPFVICITQDPISMDLQIRNSIYMMLTRSFLTTYFIMSTSNGELINTLQIGIDNINKNECLYISEPNNAQKETLRNTIINKNRISKSQYDLVEEIMDKINIAKKDRQSLHEVVKAMCKDNFDEIRIYDIIKANHTLM